MNVANWNLKVYPRFRGYSEGEYAEGCEDVSDDDACLAKAPSAASNLRWYRYGLGRIGIAVLRFPCDFGSQCYLRNFAPDFGLWYFNCQWGLRLPQFGIWSFYPVVHWKHPRFVKYQRSAKDDISRSRQISHWIEGCDHLFLYMAEACVGHKSARLRDCGASSWGWIDSHVWLSTSLRHYLFSTVQTMSLC